LAGAADAENEATLRKVLTALCRHFASTPQNLFRFSSAVIFEKSRKKFYRKQNFRAASIKFAA
jgi:hypothetical protein